MNSIRRLLVGLQAESVDLLGLLLVFAVLIFFFVLERKGPFDFMVYENTIQPIAEDIFKLKPPSTLVGTTNSVFDRSNDFSVYTPHDTNVMQENTTGRIINIGSEADLVFTTTSNGIDQGNVYIINNNNNNRIIGSETPKLQREDHSALKCKCEDTSVSVSGSNDYQYSNVSSPCTEYIINTEVNEAQYSNVSSPYNEYPRSAGMETPEDSNSWQSAQEIKLPKLKLGLNTNNPPVMINTPDVIDSVVDLESTFNILDYINEKVL